MNVMKRRDRIKKARAKKQVAPVALGSLTPYQILGEPLKTEKSYAMANDLNTYAFRVHSSANKTDVKMALKYIYNVSPKSVRMINIPYKWRMQRKLVRKAWKKALISLREWDSIELVS